LLTVEEAYLEDNPYHNSIHASDVLQSVHVILTRGGVVPQHADPLTQLACYISAVRAITPVRMHLLDGQLNTRNGHLIILDVEALTVVCDFEQMPCVLTFDGNCSKRLLLRHALALYLLIRETFTCMCQAFQGRRTAVHVPPKLFQGRAGSTLEIMEIMMQLLVNLYCGQGT